MRRHKRPQQKTTQARKTTQADNSSSEDAHIPGHHNCQKYRGTTPDQGRCTRYVALHPLRGGAPVTWRCTRTEEVHCLRIGCTAPTNKNKRGTGTPNHSPPHPSMRTWALLAAGWARRPRRPRRHLHSGPLRPTPTPPTPLNAKSPFSRTRAWNRKVATASSRHARVRSVRIYSVQMRGDNR